METPIKPKTLITVLAAAIRDEADIIAKQIVDEVKNNDVDYASLVEKYITGKSHSEDVVFSSFCENAFAEIKDTELLLDFNIELSSQWQRTKIEDKMERSKKMDFSMYVTFDYKSDPTRYSNDAAYSYGNDPYLVFEALKIETAKRLSEIKNAAPQIIMK